MLRFYAGGVTRADYWAMPGDERRAMLDYMTKALKAQQGPG